MSPYGRPFLSKLTKKMSIGCPAAAMRLGSEWLPQSGPPAFTSMSWMPPWAAKASRMRSTSAVLMRFGSSSDASTHTLTSVPSPVAFWPASWTVRCDRSSR